MNYPDTLYKEEDYSKAVKNNFVDLADLSMTYQGFYPNSPKIKHNIGMKIGISLSQVKIDFQMQTLFRLMDFLMF